jgi:hypothetical protein
MGGEVIRAPLGVCFLSASLILESTQGGVRMASPPGFTVAVCQSRKPQNPFTGTHAPGHHRSRGVTQMPLSIL